MREGLYLGDLSGPESRLTLLWLGVRGVVPMTASNPRAPRTLGRGPILARALAPALTPAPNPYPCPLALTPALSPRPHP